ncbi:MAG: UvrD-helicase domain-containing protein [Fibrobacterota bacterium]
MALDLSILNERQREAVLHDRGPLLVLAGAGSGKTRVITYKIGRCVFDLNVPPRHIMALTFTNKAAGEMQQRVEALTGIPARGLWIGTFHSLCARILRIEKHGGGNFVIYDSDDQKKVLKAVLRQLGLAEDKRCQPSDVHPRISGLKNKLITPEAFKGLAVGPFDEKFAQIYAAYEKQLVLNNALDFDDLILKAIQRLREDDGVREKYQRNIEHLLVDEYQDTNLAQYELVRLFSGLHRNVTVVGDDDQSIYSWRGADIRNILEFEKSYPDAHTVRLEQNYRSTQVILDAANAVIRNNRGRKPKTLFTDNKGGEPVEVIGCADEEQEAREIVLRVRANGLFSTAIFYRTNSQSRAIEDALRNAGLPYVIVGGLRFYERREIKDVLAYLRSLVNESDGVSLARIINVPRRGIGDKTWERLAANASQRGLSARAALARLEDIPELSSREVRALTAFRGLMDELQTALLETEPVAFVRLVIEKSGLLAALQDSEEEGAAERLANVSELVNAVDEYCQRTESPTLTGFLEEAALLTDIDTLKEGGSGEAVTLMTLHASKGLEFDRVFIAGLEEGLFPIMRADSTPADLEEERRLFYVGLTRARKKARIFYAHSRRRFGTYTTAPPSCFLEELPESCVLRADLSEVAGSLLQRPGAVLAAPRKRAFEPRERGRREEAGVSTWNAAIPESQEEVLLRQGQRVAHPLWGEGVIQELSGFNDNLKAVIKFGNSQVKKVMVKYAKLEPVG